jgi:ABC-type cobalt transport system substrate-binding protein
MKINKKIVISVLVVIVIIAVVVFVVSNFKKSQHDPISFRFDAKTKEVVFLIDEGYKIHRLQMLEGNIDVPNYDKDTREVIFPWYELEIGEHEFLYFVIQNYEGKVEKEYNIEYEILHQSANEIIIMVHSNSSPYLGERDFYSFYY